MADNLSSNRRIAKNTMMLYIRMLLSMIVSLYTSRVVLNTLGVEDFGIYGVVGGVVGMLSFLNATMSGATSRFLSVELGKGNITRLKETFNSAMIVHIGIAIVVLILAETLGLWFLDRKLVIPEERMFAAHVVYQFSILSTLIGITQVPYNAAIIAHEKMDIYAYVELLNVTLKLIIVFLLPILGNDKLIVYACLVLSVSILIAIIYRVYCFRNYCEAHIKLMYKREYVIPMLSFSGWDLFGQFGYTLRIQGVNFLLNIFFGPIVNAANSLATTVQGILLSFTSNIVMAARPVIIKAYAVQEYSRFFSLIRNLSRISFFIMVAIVVPVNLHIHIFLNLWLGQIPDYTETFIRLCLFFNCFSAYSAVILVGIHACNSVKLSGIFRLLLNIGLILLLYILLKLGFNPNVAYWGIIIMQCLIILSDTIILLRTTSNFILLKGLLFDLFVGIIYLFSVYLLFDRFFVDRNLVSLLITSFLNAIFCFVLIYIFLSNNYKRKIFIYVLNKINLKR